ncbi:MAG: glycosyltransferase family 4 protein [Acidimicrobiia bacterium]|nr:glycosyltransferase family 4 protein [Acidimicrobiia bacterium]
MDTMIDVVLRSYPVTTQTFHYQRLAEFARLGVLGTVWVESRSDGHVDPDLEALFGDRVRFIGDLPAPSSAEIARHAKLLTEAATKAKSGNGEGGPAGAVKQTLSGIRLGKYLRYHGAARLVHAAFCTANLTIARAAAQTAGLPYSTEVHSPLSWSRNPGWFRVKVADAYVVAVISDYTRKRVISHCPDARDRIVEVHCGLSSRPESPPSTNHGRMLTSVGGLVDKKGHDMFIGACDRLGEPGEVIGGGELQSDLARLIDHLDAPVQMLGELPHSEVLDRIGGSRVGVLAARQAEAGDEDGVPVALVEFMRAGVPVCSTPVAGIPELLRTIGALATENDHIALAAAIREGCAETSRGVEVVENSYSSEDESALLAKLLAAVPGPSSPDNTNKTALAASLGARRHKP